jgi:hypothetical protein
MLAQHYELIVGLFILFILMGYAIHDVLSKNDVPKSGRFIAYGVLLLGAMGFVAKGLIQLFWQASGIN